jgi:uncharacterized protein YeaO (DUF488 family)
MPRSEDSVKRAVSGHVRVKRIYEPPAAEDGYRILVDRVWPRGLSRAAARLDAWAKDLAPSTELRKWFGHRPERWDEFKRRYFRELDDRSDGVIEALAHAEGQPVSLLFAARDVRRNNAVALQAFVEQHLAQCRGKAS